MITTKPKRNRKKKSQYIPSMSTKVWCPVAVLAANFFSSHHAASSFSPSSPSSFSPLSFVHPSSLGGCRSPSHSSSRQQQPTRSIIFSSALRPNKMSNDDGQERLIRSLLDNNNAAATAGDKDPYSRYTHQIAIPLGDASELHSALHGIQTSLVRDCPRLIRACVMPALLRMPLLYVDGGSLKNNGNVLGGGGDDGDVDAILERVVHAAIREVVYGEGGGGRSGASSPPSDSASVVPAAEAAEAIVLPFRGLELQGGDNSVLYAVANDANDESDEKKKKDDEGGDDGVYVVDDWSDAASTEPKGPSGWETLEELVLKIQNKLEGEYGLATRWPLDEPQGEEIEYDDPTVAAAALTRRRWRPRIPFVRLPADFYRDLGDDFERRRNDGDDDDDGDDRPSVIDMGFDGISPLFWYEAWGGEDVVESPGVRMRSVAVYRRTAPGGGEAESSFYVPGSSDGDGAELPVGDAELASGERREAAEATGRLGEVERRAEREWEEGKARWMEEEDDDDSSLAQFDVGMEIGEVTVEGDAAYSAPWGQRDVDETPPVKIPVSGSRGEPNAPVETNAPPEGERLKSASPEAPGLSYASRPRRDLPSIEDNPIFQRLWKGRSQTTPKGQNTALALDGTPPDAPLPPYPSDPHFVGPWRVVSSPLSGGASVGDAEPKPSDNLILRVDGQVMGGPILDAEYQHKAAGGGWRMFQAVRKSDESGAPATQTRLRIRLVVPPEKERALVMEGEVTRLVMPGAGAGDANSLDGVAQPSQPAEGGEGGLLCCGGEAWMEDVEGGGNRRKVGPFSLMKLKTVDRKNLIYTVDVSRSKDEDDDEEDGGAED